MNKDLAIEATQKIQEICPSSFLFFGTLLGCIRDNSIIPWDNDLDFGILIEDWDEEKHTKLLQEAGFQTSVDVFWTHPKSELLVGKESLGKRSKKQMIYKNKSVRICFEVFSKGINNHRYSGCGGAPRIFHCPEELIAKTRKYMFHDMEVNIPEKTEEFLEYVYGSNWRIPNKSFIGSSEYKELEKKWKIFL